MDHPYIKRKIPDNIEEKMKGIKEPHWKGFKQNTYKSQKALGIIWDYVEDKIKSVREHNNHNYTDKSEANPHIMNQIQKRVDKINETKDVVSGEQFINLRNTMREAARRYYNDIHLYLKENPPKDDEFDPIYWNWLKGRHHFWRKKLLGDKHDEELILAAAVLYEQVWELSVEKSCTGDEKVCTFFRLSPKTNLTNPSFRFISSLGTSHMMC